MCPVCRTSWELSEIPQKMRHYFKEFETECGGPWERMIGPSKLPTDRTDYKGKADAVDSQHAHRRLRALAKTGRDHGLDHDHPDYSRRTLGWRPTCSHYDDRYRSEFPKAKSARKRWQRDLSGNWWERVRKRPGKQHWPVKPPIVLDPFAGVGTTPLVALQHRRNFFGIELNPGYCEMARKRIAKVQARLF